ncbi:UNVERIFIED_CONTAM: Kinesin-like protein KIN-12F [Sesamum radiatum]|uniref:Kinesin-like protein KIN-12F n=1 Tax=Sesamum radiatum TaxID=300843 RepID=A0AAW2LR68_SESRA
MAKPNSEISENSRFFGSISASVPFRNLLPKAKQKSVSTRRSKFRLGGENIAPIDPNIQIRDPPLSASVSFPKKSPSKLGSCPQKDEITASLVQEKEPEAPDPPVKVVVRIRPANGLGIGDTSVRIISKDSIAVAEKNYTFDSVWTQTRLSAMVDGPSASGLQGIVPRIFQNLFSEIQKEQGNSDGKQTNYQCRCSFLEVYDGKIGDLLDPTQRNLEIKDDTKNGFYVENLTEEYVTCYEDVTQILIKENNTMIQEENEKLKKQIEKLKRKHKMEMITMKQYLAESRLPEAALGPLYRQDSDTVHHDTIQDDDQAWRAEFGAIYQEHY